MKDEVALALLVQGDRTDGAPTMKDSNTPIRYPIAPRGQQVDDYHGTKVADPYRWLEDPDSPQTRDWVEAENKVTSAFLDAIPERRRIRKRLTKLWDYEKFGIPFQRGG